MRRTSFAAMPCPVARSLDVLGDAWTLLIVREALNGARRFDDFVDRLGIPRNTLTARLATLADSGILERQAYQDAPPRHDYVLTEKGLALRTVIVSLLQWGEEFGDWPADGSPVELRDRRTGDRLWFDHIDRDTGRPIEEIDIERVVRPVTTGST